MTVVDWDGKEIPKELRALPKGRYVIAPADFAPELTPEEEEGLEKALESLRQGRGVPIEQVRARLDGILKR